MNILLQNIAKKYNNNWIFKSINLEINSFDKLAIMGANGSGKSTFLQIIAGYVTHSVGTITYKHQGNLVERDYVYKHLSIAAPSVELIEEFTLNENITFFTKLKPLINKLSLSQFVSLCYLESSANKPLSQFSSGMKQRVKLALAITADVPLLLLDEPTSNLDKQGIDWYKNLVNDFTKNKTCVVCSNQINDEFFFCNKQLVIDDHKK